MRLAFVGLGLLFTGLGFLGAFLPILPSTPFFLIAAYLFSRSHPRLEAWLLSLPQVGPLVKNYREGRGISKKTKVLATALALGAAGISAYGLPHPAGQVAVLLLIAYGLYFIWSRVPTLAPEEGPKDQELPEG
ncbi:YbaN family protein [Thermus neutrinimicus]|uniref:YbaN family protein n=1 Tax=Thermus neutrinimicus TaxID=2908149 RepID=UPI001FA988F6|nr:YbaN family protein [Thermus neutrinimicus]